MKSRLQILNEIDLILKELDICLDKKLKEKLVLMIERVLDNDQQDNYLIIEGDTGCISGDTIIRYSRGHNTRKATIRKLFELYNKPEDYKKKFDFNIPTYTRSFNGKEIKLHKIRNVLYSGKKNVYKISLEDGKEIKATADHKFIRLGQEWVELENLNIGDSIMCDKPIAIKSDRKKIKLRDIKLKVDYHPYINPLNKEVEVHRLIYEARMNNLDFLEYIDILLNEPNKSKQLKFIDPSIYSIHHKDGCHYNNSIENLELMTIEEHLKLHGNNNYDNFSQGKPTYIKIKDIKEIGIEDTYDIECEEPYHNFVANDIVVHNSGKTNLSVLVAHIVSRIADRKFNEDNIYFDVAKATDFAKSTKEQILIFDEPAFGGLKREWQSKVQLNLIKLLFTSRKLRHFVILNLVKFNKFSDDLIERAIAMIRVYRRDNSSKVRRFIYYKQKNITFMMDYWKRKHQKNYMKFASFKGSLPTYVMPKIINVDKYELEKDKSIMSIGAVDDKKVKQPVREMELRHKIWLMVDQIHKQTGIRKDAIAKMVNLDERTIQKYKYVGFDGISIENEDENARSAPLIINNGVDGKKIVKDEEKKDTTTI